MDSKEKLNKIMLFSFIIIGLNLIILNIVLISSYLKIGENVLGVSTSKSSENKCSTGCKKYIDKIAKTSSTQSSQSSPKEYFISLGSGNSSSSDWTDVPGAQSYIDLSKYPNAKIINFEASVKNPYSGQEVFVRLYNVTDKKALYSSEIKTNGDGKLVSSGPVVLDSGEKLYQVQMKTQLNAQANLTQARIKIIAN